MPKISRNLKNRDRAAQGNSGSNVKDQLWQKNGREEEFICVAHGGQIKVNTSVAVESRVDLRERDGKEGQGRILAEYYKFPDAKGEGGRAKAMG